MKAMTSKERLMAAVRSEEVDHVPMHLVFYTDSAPRHAKVSWRDTRERLAVYREWGWDTDVRIPTVVTPSPEVTVRMHRETQGGETVLRQTWQTPAGTLDERLRVTDDWEQARNATRYLGFNSDHRTTRYLEIPLKPGQDLAVLDYLFPEESPADAEEQRRCHASARALADEFQVPLTVYHWAGMDWLLWLFPAEEAVMRLLDDGPWVHALLDKINAAYRQRLDVYLELGVDAVLRRGWYESTDFWSPDIFVEFAEPPLAEEIARVRRAGVAHLYQMCTGITPLLPELARLPFDCLLGAEPVLGGAQDLGEIRRALPGKSVWGGISGPEHLGRGRPEDTERAVEEAFALCGRRGFLLGPGVSIRADWPWANIQACERAWKRLRRWQAPG